MNKKVTVLLAIIALSTISGAAAYSNYYAIEQADVQIKDSTATIDNSTVVINNSNVTIGENNTITNPPAENNTLQETNEPPTQQQPPSHTLRTSEYATTPRSC